MNWQHLQLILWLRWRLSYNQWRRTGKLNLVLTVGLVAAGLISAVLAFFVALILGCFLLPKAEPDHMMIMWDLIIVSFLFLWSMGVVTELQRTEFLSLEKMLHFPISPTGAFLLNYLSSLVSFAIILFLPAMIALCIASVVTHGPAMLLLFPLVFAFVLALSALTYQFRGWMATLMQNKRRRRTIIALVTAAFILMTQVPNLAHLAFRQHQKQARSATQAAAHKQLLESSPEEVDPGQPRQPQMIGARPEPTAAEKQQERAGRVEAMIEILAVVNLVVPAGWLAYGARAAADGHLWPGLLGSLGMILMGTASLWRSHRATMRMYTGQLNSKKSRRVAKPDSPRITAAPFLERSVPGCSEQVSAVVFVGLRNLFRAAGGQDGLAVSDHHRGDLRFVVVYGSRSGDSNGGASFSALLSIGTTMLGLMQLMINVFGADRGGFRAFVLMPIARRDILFGKNLALAPFALVLATLLIVSLQIFLPLKTMHFVATLIQCIPAYLLACLVGNMTSIFAPMTVASGSLKPVQPKFWTMMVQMFAMMTTPLLLMPAMVALGIELLLDKFGGGRWFPFYLLVTVIELPISVFAYRFLLTRQGRLLQRREARILEVVAGNVE